MIYNNIHNVRMPKIVFIVSVKLWKHYYYYCQFKLMCDNWQYPEKQVFLTNLQEKIIFKKGTTKCGNIFDVKILLKTNKITTDKLETALYSAMYSMNEPTTYCASISVFWDLLCFFHTSNRPHPLSLALWAVSKNR